MNLPETLYNLEKYLDLVPDSLLPYAESDNIGGFHPDPTQRQWDMGAIWDVEGRILYSLIRALKPLTVVEIGSGTGCSATHIASALRANSAGHITTVDRGNTPHVPEELQARVEIRNDDAINYLVQLPDHSIDFLYEDADHTSELCAAIGELAKSKLKPGGVLLVHDAAHWAVGHDVCLGYDKAGLDFRVYLTEPSDCGFAIWKAPQVDYSPVIDTTVLQAQEEPNADVVSEAINTLTYALHDNESTEDKLKDFSYEKAVQQPVKRTRKPKAKK